MFFFPIDSATPYSNQVPRIVVKSSPKLQPNCIIEVDSEANSYSDSGNDCYVFEQPKLFDIVETASSADIIHDNLPCSPSGVTGAADTLLEVSPRRTTHRCHILY